MRRYCGHVRAVSLVSPPPALTLNTAMAARAPAEADKLIADCTREQQPLIDQRDSLNAQRSAARTAAAVAETEMDGKVGDCASGPPCLAAATLQH